MTCFKTLIRIVSSKSEYQRKFVFSFKKLQIIIVFPKESSIFASSFNIKHKYYGYSRNSTGIGFCSDVCRSYCKGRRMQKIGNVLADEKGWTDT